jgi:hypothetical protein
VRHLVDAEERYFSIPTRERFPTNEAAAAFVFPDPLPDGPVPLDELAQRIRRLGRRWEALVADTGLADRDVTTTDGFHVPGALPMAQAIHHADDHRTRSCRSSARAAFRFPISVCGITLSQEG